ncbi:pyridoxamine 5'-phosphate oxidase family protein [Parafrigoribacterium mesophilum]|uniref:pyridoxamine 5'-phosphate oxidase family protein n=1 Tax=Parafrigoribacterium mesophilum TaxID=433646 RepID=UPI0031FD8B6C
MTTHSERRVEDLSADECWKLLAAAPLGRLATAVADPATGELFLDVFPVNFLVHEGAIFFRTGPGAKLMDITANDRVAFEADGQTGGFNWSVVVHGSAHRLMLDGDIEQSGVLELDATHPTDKWNYVRITVDAITGIRFRR